MKNWLLTLKTLAFSAVLGALVFSCEKDDPSDIDTDLQGDPLKESFELAKTWNDVQLGVERFTPGYRPPIAARTLGYTGLAAYEAIVNGMSDKYNSFDGYFKGLDIPEPNSGEEYHWPTVLNATYARAITHFYPTAPAAQLFNVYSTEQDFNEKFRLDVPNAVYVRSQDFGRLVADAVFNWSRTDKDGDGAFLRTSDPNYVPPGGVGKWKPTFPDFSPALLPYWGKVRTFVADATDVCPEPLAYSTDPNSEIYKQALEPFNLVNQIKAGTGNATTEHWIADFWSDDCATLTFTPAGRFIAVATQLIEKEDLSLGEAVELYARVGMGLADAGIRAWHQKFTYNYQRPIDYIRQVMPNASNWNSVMCPDGSGRYFTPPFPAYPSGHATFGAVAAEIFSNVLGENYQFTDRCHEGRTEFIGKPRTFTSFRQMAEENAYSRLPIGVHFRMDATSGVSLGYGIGKKVNKLPWRK
ncbi:MAG TPA: phosphatase PAP2 family protein [Haliscomenobacter sp.]|uniref:vanadium-dependent haloperoxidase n=1 Tax=Haliscomenobacter sp. TaxID=2717303 RepID=UPI002CA6AF9B|nr:phosphatase PAP2 family protein [Haliscomenobacter sp.]HOY17332.1 phosphatase PAP2 family protein [Haliscomenobacter sp.]HPH19556.1 phosphatase PAP2 family protein [Haliscomenobacter sp.]